MNGKKLYRSESNRMLCGVCAGIAVLPRRFGYPGVYYRRDHHSVREHAQ